MAYPTEPDVFSTLTLGFYDAGLYPPDHPNQWDKEALVDIRNRVVWLKDEPKTWLGTAAGVIMIDQVIELPYASGVDKYAKTILSRAFPGDPVSLNALNLPPTMLDMVEKNDTSGIREVIISDDSIVSQYGADSRLENELKKQCAIWLSVTFDTYLTGFAIDQVIHFTVVGGGFLEGDVVIKQINDTLTSLEGQTYRIDRSITASTQDPIIITSEIAKLFKPTTKVFGQIGIG